MLIASGILTKNYLLGGQVLTFIIVLSVSAQLLSVLFALRLIKVTGGITAWIFVSMAIVLMSGRRIYSLLDAFNHPVYQSGLLFEMLGLATSLLMLAGVVLISPLFKTIRHSEENQRMLANELRDTLSKVKTLSGMMPICASCKKIRDDKGYWNQIEGYIRDHSEAEFSHGLCPDCAKKLYPDFFKE